MSKTPPTPQDPREGTQAKMKQVADIAGVAISTVSRALTTPGRVNEKTRQRVLAAARQLGYTPNAAARSLRRGKAGTIMIVLPGHLIYGASQVVPFVLSGIDKGLGEQGYKIMIANLDREESSEQHILDLATSGAVDGAIVISSALPEAYGKTLADTGLPVVAVLHDISGGGTPSVITNETEIMREATLALITCGHRRFFYVAGPAGGFHEVVRLAGIHAALHDAGLPENAVITSRGDRHYQEGFLLGREAADLFLALADRPTGVLCTSDDAAISFMARLRENGVDVPRDAAVIGFDGAPVGEFLSPSLSTIVQPAEDMGGAAARLLLRKLAGDEVALQHVLPSRLLLRASV